MNIKIPNIYLSNGVSKLEPDELLIYYFICTNELLRKSNTSILSAGTISHLIPIYKKDDVNKTEIVNILLGLRNKKAVDFEDVDKNFKGKFKYDYPMVIKINKIDDSQCTIIDNEIFDKIIRKAEERYKGIWFMIYAYLLIVNREVSYKELALTLNYKSELQMRKIVSEIIESNIFIDQFGKHLFTGYSLLKDLHQIESKMSNKELYNYVYFIKDEKNDAIKIGVTSNVKSRFSQLQTSSSNKLELLKFIDGGYDTEKELHKKFDNYRLSGEWFKASSELLEYIDSL